MSKQELSMMVKPVEEYQLDLLKKEISDDPQAHHKRYDVQKRGKGLYLIAWHDSTPIGHFLLRWSGPDDARVTNYVDIAQSACLEAGATRAEYQRKGVATAIIREAERLAKERGCSQIGLEVGNTDNPGAKKLYEKLGYVDWGHGEFQISWDYIDENGNKRTDTEIVIYMQKNL